MRTAFPETKEKEKKQLRLSKEKVHREKINHIRRELKAAGTQRKTGLRLDRMEEVKALQYLSIQEQSVRCQEKDLFNSCFAWAQNNWELHRISKQPVLSKQQVLKTSGRRLHANKRSFRGSSLCYMSLQSYQKSECFRGRTKPFLPFLFLHIQAVEKNCLDQSIEPPPLVNYSNILIASQLAGNSHPRDRKGQQGLSPASSLIWA